MCERGDAMDENPAGGEGAEKGGKENREVIRMMTKSRYTPIYSQFEEIWIIFKFHGYNVFIRRVQGEERSCLHRDLAYLQTPHSTKQEPQDRARQGSST